MKEEGQDHVVTGFKNPSDGWHIFEFKEGIDYRKNEAGDAPFVNDNGFKTLILPCVVSDPNDPDDGANNNQFVGMEKGGPWLANILACVGLWEAVKKRFPGPDVSVFDQPVLDGIKAKLPGLKCMMKTELEKGKGKDVNKVFVRTREMASFAKYKEIEKEEKEKAAANKKGSGGAVGKETQTPATEAAGNDW